jgi:hypothetical protein
LILPAAKGKILLSWWVNHYFSRFSSLLLLILLGAFLAFSSLGAGLDERTQTPLGAHQRRFRSQ